MSVETVVRAEGNATRRVIVVAASLAGVALALAMLAVAALGLGDGRWIAAPRWLPLALLLVLL
ncbi:MAG: hypothetical protein HOQ09_14145, partial [Gemmatimonadaceae bacterium]|nr:hypothetical protein [Gemmatimonadaceae bacterium]